MKLTKAQLLEAALALNGDDKSYQITVEDDKIITRVKWMDAMFFSPDAITEEMKTFTYTVKVNDNGTYTEVDKTVSKSTSAKSGGFGYQKSVFVGKQITVDKTIGLGKNKQTGQTGVIGITFNSEEYKNPVRTLLKNSGYKKKMGTVTKVLIGAAILVVVAATLAIILINQTNNKKAVSVSDFEAAAESFGYQIAVDETVESYDYVENVRIAVDTEDDYQIDLYVLSDADRAKTVYENNKATLEEKLSRETGTSSSVHSPKYEKYSASTKESFLYIARVDNTVLYIDVDIEHKAEVEKFIKEIDY